MRTHIHLLASTSIFVIEPSKKLSVDSEDGSRDYRVAPKDQVDFRRDFQHILHTAV